MNPQMTQGMKDIRRWTQMRGRVMSEPGARATGALGCRECKMQNDDAQTSQAAAGSAAKKFPSDRSSDGRFLLKILKNRVVCLFFNGL
jgi:hypothetical protein